MDTATTALIVALNDAKLDVTSRNRDALLEALITQAREAGRTDVVARLAAARILTRSADVSDSLGRIARDLYRAA